MNTGFAGGNNLGLQKSTGDFLLLLNSDTILTENSILKTVEYFKTLKNAGVMGCRMIFPNGRIQFTARRFRSIRWELLDLFRFIPFLMPYQKRSQLMLGKYFRHDKSTDCDWVNGAFFLFTKKILLQLQDQKLDDRFFMYGEDQLWCEQIRHLGYRIIFYAGTTIVHINSGSTEKSKQLNLRKIMMQHEIEIMQIRKGKGFYYYVFKIIFLIKENSRNLIKSVIFWFTSRQIR
jgi:GT2 family glycosyltransferase